MQEMLFKDISNLGAEEMWFIHFLSRALVVPLLSRADPFVQFW